MIKSDVFLVGIQFNTKQWWYRMLKSFLFLNVSTSLKRDDDFKLVETLRNKNDFNIRYHHYFIKIFSGSRN